MATYVAPVPVTCPFCMVEHPHYSGTNVEGPPTEGAVSLCWSCHKPSFFTADGGLRMPDDVEYVDLMSDPDVRSAIHAMRESYTPREALGLLSPMPLELNDD